MLRVWSRRLLWLGANRRQRKPSIPHGHEFGLEPLLQKREAFCCKYTENATYGLVFMFTIDCALGSTYYPRFSWGFLRRCYPSHCPRLHPTWTKLSIARSGTKHATTLVLYILTFWCTIDALIRDIRTDVEVAKKSLQRPAYDQLRSHSLFTGQH